MFRHEMCSFSATIQRHGEAMKLAASLAAVGLALALGSSYADTSNTNSKDKGKMQEKASPSAAKSDEERAEASQGQPNVPHSSAGGTAKPKSKPKKSPESKKGKGSSSAGSTAPAAEVDSVAAQRFKALDIDGDGAISKAEAAGNADLVTGFDRADRNRDGKLSRAEYDALGKPKAKKQQASR
jgi:hypothetical protein